MPKAEVDGRPSRNRRFELEEIAEGIALSAEHTRCGGYLRDASGERGYAHLLTTLL